MDRKSYRIFYDIIENNEVEDFDEFVLILTETEENYLMLCDYMKTDDIDYIIEELKLICDNDDYLYNVLNMENY